MSDNERVHIIGIGDDGFDGLTTSARDLIHAAEILIGPKQLFTVIPISSATRIETSGKLDELVDNIAKNSEKRIVLLTTGDPLFYGTARFLCDQLGKDRFEVIPHVSSMQLAFARVKESWEEAYLTNLATQSLDRVIERVRTAEKVGIFTSEEVPPSTVARALLDSRIDYFSVYICENLGSPDERVTQGELTEVAEQKFATLNVMILIRKPDVPDRPNELKGRRLFGNPDELFRHAQPKRGLATPSEVRSIALAEMDLGPTSIIWDVGAGSGSVAIESAQISSAGTVYAIEMDSGDHQLLAENMERFGVRNVVPVLGQAPDAWTDLPDPDAIFVGGTGRMVANIVDLAIDRLRSGGRLVANITSLENVVAVRDVIQKKIGESNLWMVTVARGMPQMETLRFESMNPTFLIGAIKS
ncbi:MAG: precorrin-6Y C5,15-methyltransferase (decarboxylating) [Pirellulaceae bacterium]